MIPRRVVAGLAALLVLVVFAPRLAPWDPERSLDPAVLRLRAPLSRVPMLVTREGRLVPVGGDTAREMTGLPYRIEGGEIVYPRGRRFERRPLGEFARDDSGRPLIVWRRFLAGTDGFGRDLFSRMLWGLRLSVLIALSAVAGAATLAAFVGLAGGLAGRIVDAVLGLAGDALLSVPRIVLVMALAVAVRPTPVMLALVLAATGWPAMARLVRTEVRRARASDVVLAARAAGVGSLRTALVHVLPEALATLAVAAALRVAPTVLTEAALSFLGAGVAPPAASLGTILAEGRELLLEAWWISAIPGLALVAVVLAISRAVDRFQLRWEAGATGSSPR